MFLLERPKINEKVAHDRVVDELRHRRIKRRIGRRVLSEDRRDVRDARDVDDAKVDPRRSPDSSML